jgi:hypothetical protein
MQKISRIICVSQVAVSQALCSHYFVCMGSRRRATRHVRDNIQIFIQYRSVGGIYIPCDRDRDHGCDRGRDNIQI